MARTKKKSAKNIRSSRNKISAKKKVSSGKKVGKKRASKKKRSKKYSDTPVFVWRCSVPPSQNTGGNCLYCGYSLSLPFITREIFDCLDVELRNAVITAFRNFCGEAWERELEKFLKDGKHGIHSVVDSNEPTRACCKRCGWWLNGYREDMINYVRTAAAGLLTLDINDSKLAIPEVCSHLASNYSDVYTLSPRRFEFVVANIYRELGWNVEVTKQSRDGGIDLICLSKSSGTTCIVECKRFNQSRKVGIYAVDRLLGVQIRTGVKEAHLITSSTFSRDAKNAHNEALTRKIKLDLLDGHELLQLLNCYSDKSLTVRDIKSIFDK